MQTIETEDQYWEHFYRQTERRYREGRLHGWISGFLDALALWGQDKDEVRLQAQAYLQSTLKPWVYGEKDETPLTPPTLTKRLGFETKDSD